MQTGFAKRSSEEVVSPERVANVELGSAELPEPEPDVGIVEFLDDLERDERVYVLAEVAETEIGVWNPVDEESGEDFDQPCFGAMGYFSGIGL